MTWAPSYIDRTALAHFIAGEAMADDRIAADGVELDEDCETGSRCVDGYAGRQFGLVAAPEARLYTLSWSWANQMWFAEVDDFMTVAGMVLAWDSAGDGTYASTISTSLTMKTPGRAAQRSRPWEQIYFRPTVPLTFDGRMQGLRATAQWGWTSVPKPAITASKIQASRLFARRQSPYGVAGSPQEGSEVRLSARLDPDLRSSLRTYRRRAWAR